VRRSRQGRAGHVYVGVTAAILVILGGWILADQMGWWAAWPWWGKALFVLGAVTVYVIGAAWEKSRRRPDSSVAPGGADKSRSPAGPGGSAR